jgi:multiple sugar transport system substrate-binding protein
MEDNQAMTEGMVAMSMNYFSYFADLADPEMNPYWEETGYFAMPEGPMGRHAVFGGQGASVVAYSQKRELALDWLEWFVRPETQAMWGELGGFPGDVETLGSGEYLDMAPYNRAYAQTAKIVKGFWADPESSALLEVSQKHWYDYVIAGNDSAKKALDNTAKEWEGVFRKSGYYE